MVTGYVYDDRMTNHFHPYEGHPEQPDRIRCIHDSMQEHKLLSKCIKIPIIPSTIDQICAIHDSKYVSQLVECQNSNDEMEIIRFAKKFNSIYLNQFSLEAALFAAGGTVELAKAILDKRINNGFAIVRPPGHHAESHCAMGFCLFNNVAVAINAIKNLHPATRVMILDWDIHHGNGTQEIFLQDPNVLYISIHRYENASFYPHSEEGNCTQIGIGKGTGKTVNIPWPDCGMGDADYIHVFNRIVLPIAHEFAPDLVIVSAGFDAAVGDPIGECMVTPDGFAMMTYMLKGLANGKVMLVLEGGYDLDSLSLGATACMKILLGMDPPQLDICIPSKIAIETANEVIKCHSQHWRSLGYSYKDYTFPEAGKPIILTNVLIKYWNELLESSFQMTGINLNNFLLRRFEKYLHVSETFLTNEKGLVFFVHGNGFLRNSNMSSNIPDSVEITLNLPYTDYISALHSEGYSVVDLMIPMNEMLEAYASETDDVLPLSLELIKVSSANATPSEGKQKFSLLDKLLSYIWRNVVLISKSQNTFILAADEACRIVFDLVDRESVEETSLKGIIMLHSDAKLIPCPRPKALWLYERSLFIYPNDANAGSFMNFGRLFGNTISSGSLCRHDYPRLLEQFRENVIEFIKKKSIL